MVDNFELAQEEFQSSEKELIAQANKIQEQRKKLGLDGLVKGLEAIIINVEPDNFFKAIQELLNYTGYDIQDSFFNQHRKCSVLSLPGSADILITAYNTPRPNQNLNLYPKNQSLPNTRLETFIFKVEDLDKYTTIQEEAGIKFEERIKNNNFKYVKTYPSAYTNNSLGFMEWKNKKSYRLDTDQDLELNLTKPQRSYLKYIGKLDHAATRVKAIWRNKAILEFMSLTNYNFDFAIYVNQLNSITSVTRLSEKDFALVFTSGIQKLESKEIIGPTEGFIHYYGPRVHHLAFYTENIEEVFKNLKQDGLSFLIDLVGSEEEGLKQTFSCPSAYTFLVNEYIKRFGDFKGFFTKSNVTSLTKATEKQL